MGWLVFCCKYSTYRALLSGACVLYVTIYNVTICYSFRCSECRSNASFLCELSQVGVRTHRGHHRRLSAIVPCRTNEHQPPFCRVPRGRQTKKQKNALFPVLTPPDRLLYGLQANYRGDQPSYLLTHYIPLLFINTRPSRLSFSLPYSPLFLFPLLQSSRESRDNY